MPDYTVWRRGLDHRSEFLYKGKATLIHDQHYSFTNEGQTEGKTVVLFYKPENDQLWFALYLHEKVDSSTQEIVREEYFFEPGAVVGRWRCVAAPKDQTETDQVFKSKYNLESSR